MQPHRGVTHRRPRISAATSARIRSHPPPRQVQRRGARPSPQRPPATTTTARRRRDRRFAQPHGRPRPAGPLPDLHHRFRPVRQAPPTSRSETHDRIDRRQQQRSMRRAAVATANGSPTAVVRRAPKRLRHRESSPTTGTTSMDVAEYPLRSATSPAKRDRSGPDRSRRLTGTCYITRHALTQRQPDPDDRGRPLHRRRLVPRASPSRRATNTRRTQGDADRLTEGTQLPARDGGAPRGPASSTAAPVGAIGHHHARPDLPTPQPAYHGLRVVSAGLPSASAASAFCVEDVAFGLGFGWHPRFALRMWPSVSLSPGALSTCLSFSGSALVCSLA